MVVKTETCSYTEAKIYPGHGKKFAAKDGKMLNFITKKAANFYHRKTKAVKLTWTMAWRRFNKKVKMDDQSRRKTKKTTRVQKAIVGMSLDEIRRRKAEKPEERDKKMEVSKKEVADKNKKAQDAKRSQKVAQKVQSKAQSKAAPKPKQAANKKR
eukprot:NODE_4939_length_615_cov_62.415194_g4255_i0.p1 GENE.NODE_4939_length_615_cov_62.415194_g4255_i0~~NODE_4939_length_615_cov_62.415194_g4255_i0.p1  ORF type:complete len:155 (+),score=46.30 NODE_4939_length_615_cov_62.415194_g4255_i0:69-533(+)